MNLSTVYEQWRTATLQEGRQEGRQEGLWEGDRRNTIALLQAEFGTLDAALMEILPSLIQLAPAERAMVILRSSQEELLEQFQ